MYRYSYFTATEELLLVLAGLQAATVLLFIIVVSASGRSSRWTIVGISAVSILMPVAYMFFAGYHERYVSGPLFWQPVLGLHATSSRFAITVGLFVWVPLIILGAKGWFRVHSATRANPRARSMDSEGGNR